MVDGLRARRRQSRATALTELAISERSVEPQEEQALLRKQLLDCSLRGLPRRHRLVIVLRYFEGLSMEQVGSCLGITEARVSQLHARALVALHDRI
jgi:RNA polymerase sigma factor for flagellar operon FliA